MWQEIHKTEMPGRVQCFVEALQVWIKKPHVLNRKLRGAKILHESLNIESLTDFLLTLEERLSTSQEYDSSKMYEGLKKILETQKADSGVKSTDFNIYIRDLLPKQIEKHPVLREIVLLDAYLQQAIFFGFESIQPDGNVTDIQENTAYKVQLHGSGGSQSLGLHILGDPEAYSANGNLGHTMAWLQHKLLPRLAVWSCEERLNTDITSLRLVPVDRYNQLYNQLKVKYGIPLAKKWPECTDPQKFVFEDIAIATYLLLLWEDDRQKKGLAKKQTFVDLGCGNGLLVYVLQAEGHDGLGLDLRRRNIWDMYDIKPKLKEQAITPSDETLYPEYDWLIGNHSDELTPWIPVMAARSSHTCSYFVLPCCAWDFSQKFRHKSTGVSQYRSYLTFVKEVGEACGYSVEEDTLRIPSTKRVCLIGRSRVYEEPEEAEFDRKRQVYINSRCAQTPSHKSDLQEDPQGHSATSVHQQDTLPQPDCESPEVTSTKVAPQAGNTTEGGVVKRKWAADFKARDSVEKPRNCISVSSEVKGHITHTVFKALLNQKVMEKVQLPDGNVWNRGGSLPLSNVASMFDQDMLQQLKCECGGVQTLLRNNHHIFRVQRGMVQLRDWTTDDYNEHQQQKRRRKGKPSDDPTHNKKTKLCFFHDNHPQGCPLVAEECRFAHGEIDLREKVP